MSDISSLSTEELRKKIEKKKTDISKGLNITRFRNPLDKLTSVDELLRELIQEQRDLIDKIHISNKLLLTLVYKDGGSIAPNGVDTTAILEGLRGGDDYRTLNPIFNNVIVDGSKEVFNVEGSGWIDVIKFISSNSSTDNKDYSVRIMCDNNTLYSNTWTELEARTPTERGMICYEDDDRSEYILIFKTILYTNNLIIEIYDSSATLSMIQVKYHEKV